jgi:WD40 repeat protein
LVTGSADTTARLWDLAAQEPAVASRVLRAHNGPIHALCISPDNRRLVTASGQTHESPDNTVRLWDLPLENLLARAQCAAAQCADAEQRQQRLR